MLSLAGLVAIVAVTPAEPISLVRWFPASEYPSRALIMHQQGDTAYRLTVSPEGKMISCDIAESSGSPNLDNFVCPQLERRARFKPALDEHGKPTTAVYRNRIRWIYPGAGGPDRYISYDIALRVKALPSGFETPYRVQIALVVEADGSVSGCSPKDITIPKALVNVACAQAASALKPVPPKDQNGAAVRSVQNADIVFISDAPKGG